MCKYTDPVAVAASRVVLACPRPPKSTWNDLTGWLAHMCDPLITTHIAEPTPPYHKQTNSMHDTTRARTASQRWNSALECFCRTGRPAYTKQTSVTKEGRKPYLDFCHICHRVNMCPFPISMLVYSHTMHQTSNLVIKNIQIRIPPFVGFVPRRQSVFFFFCSPPLPY